MDKKIRGLHHVTAIASDPQCNLDFYIGLLGLRLVKRTVNFDDPATYHFYFGDARGTPGTILTFFPWPDARPGRRGVRQIEAMAFAISPDSAGYWLDRFKEQHVTAEKRASRFGEEVIRFTDPDGLLLELIASDSFGKTESWIDPAAEQTCTANGSQQSVKQPSKWPVLNNQPSRFSAWRLFVHHLKSPVCSCVSITLPASQFVGREKVNRFARTNAI